ncbi:MAG: cation-transporting P-type ATPase, partial [Steroidobacteraceae bacterium]|nr:cation-transporting P-type ATPase [Steroidobacteraceae bacterium]
QALRELRALATPLAWVRRDGRWQRLPARELVPQDIVRIEAGERIPADGVVVDAAGLLIDESLLTGESVPVDKTIGSEVLSGTLAVRGKTLLRITRTGARSAMGRLASMLEQIGTSRTPLERRLHALGTTIARWVGGLAALIAIVGTAVEGIDRIGEILLFAVALAVAAVPEGMPAVVTLALALGVQRMARRKAVVRRLSAVEGLGSVNVIATDKTGTLTENRMIVHRLVADDPNEALLAMVLANDAEADGGTGDPLELGLLQHAAGAGIDALELRRRHPRRDARAFDSAWKFMRVTVATPNGERSYLKGAPEVLLARSDLDEAARAEWRARAEREAAAGYRILAFAAADGASETRLRFLGFASLWDPPRPEVPEAVASAQRAGLRILMITGDHPATAQAVAARIGLANTAVLTGAELAELGPDELRTATRTHGVFARVSPEDKLRLVEALRADGQIVAMTGDGVNDAAALKRADIGVAMGQRGSDVTREVADLVLLDDNFATIVAAIEEGRSIYANIQKFVRFLFSTNVALVMLVVLGTVGAYLLDLRAADGTLILPLTALQLLWINFVADGPPALALAFDRNPHVMQHAPRPADSPLLDGPSLRFVMWTGCLKGLAGVALWLALPLLGFATSVARTVVFVFESIVQLVFAYPARHVGQPAAHNFYLHVIVALSIALQVATVVVPALRQLLGLDVPDATGWFVVATAIVVVWALAEWISQRVTDRR